MSSYDFVYFSDSSLKAVPSSLKKSSTKKNIEVREQLQALGWYYEALPTFYTFPQSETDKICLYMETPQGLPESKQPAWIKLMLNIYSKGRINDYKKIKPSQKYGKKPRIMSFKSQPYILNKAVFQADNLPTVIVCFDALKGFDYRLAQGVNSGILCCERMLWHIKIRDGVIYSIDASSIEDDIFSYINSNYKKNIVMVQSSRRQAIEKGYEYFSEIYIKAAEELPNSKKDRKLRYELIARELIYQRALIEFEKLHNSDKREASDSKFTPSTSFFLVSDSIKNRSHSLFIPPRRSNLNNLSLENLLTSLSEDDSLSIDDESDNSSYSPKPVNT